MLDYIPYTHHLLLAEMGTDPVCVVVKEKRIEGTMYLLG